MQSIDFYIRILHYWETVFLLYCRYCSSETMQTALSFTFLLWDDMTGYSWYNSLLTEEICNGICALWVVCVVYWGWSTEVRETVKQYAVDKEDVQVSAESVEKWLFCGYFWRNCTQMLNFGRIDVIGLSSLLIWPGCLVLGGKGCCFWCFGDLVWVRLSWGICWCLVRKNSAKQAKKIKRKITNFKTSDTVSTTKQFDNFVSNRDIEMR